MAKAMPLQRVWEVLRMSNVGRWRFSGYLLELAIKVRQILKPRIKTNRLNISIPFNQHPAGMTNAHFVQKIGIGFSGPDFKVAAKCFIRQIGNGGYFTDFYFALTLFEGKL